MKPLYDNKTGKLGVPKTEFEFNRKGDILEFNFVAYDSSLESFSNEKNSELWKGNVVEVFLDCGDRKFYYEFEVAPNGTTFVAEKHKNKLMFIDDKFFSAETRIEGNSYCVKMSIDLKLLGKKRVISYNAFRIEGDVLEALHPTLCDTFHVREKFLKF